MKKLDNSSIERARRPVRVLQFGEGNFLRAFADWMIDIANRKGVTDTDVAVVSPRFKENRGIKTLQNQDGLYHVWLEGIDNGQPLSRPHLVECIADAFSPAADFNRYESHILSPDLRFVISNTTEAGIRYEEDDVMSPTPATFPGKVTSMLYRRFRHFNGDPSKGLIFLCCELIEDNGSTLKEYVLRHAKEAGLAEGFSNWVKEANIFCDTLVDRIVPGFPSDSITEIKEKLGYDDDMVVKGELFHVWAIGSDRHDQVHNEFPLDKAGLNVLFMDSIKAFRDKKVRILNGSHTGMVPIALQLGCETVLDAFGHPAVSRFINTMMTREVLPVIEGDPEELRRFADGILERFYNPYMRHMLKSIALNSLSKWEARNFPTVRDQWEKNGTPAEFEIFTFAALMALYAPCSSFSPDDDKAYLSKINEAWQKHPGDYAAIIKDITGSGIFTVDFESIVPGFSSKAGEYLGMIMNDGMSKALDDFLVSHGEKYVSPES